MTTASRGQIYLGAVALSLAVATSASAQVVNFQGVVVPVCVLTPSAGVLAISSGGTTIGSEETGGAAATLAVTSSGGAPTISFTAPTLAAKPVAYSGTPTVSLKFSATSGATQAYTSNSSSYTSSNPLADTITLNAKANDSGGFVQGTYRISTTATCSQ